MSIETFNDMLKDVYLLNLEYKAYPKQYLINVTDVDDTIQSYYASTRTAIFRDGNDKYRSKKHIEHNFSWERFLKLCLGDEDIIEAFFTEQKE